MSCCERKRIYTYVNFLDLVLRVNRRHRDDFFSLLNRNWKKNSCSSLSKRKHAGPQIDSVNSHAFQADDSSVTASKEYSNTIYDLNNEGRHRRCVEKKHVSYRLLAQTVFDTRSHPWKSWLLLYSGNKNVLNFIFQALSFENLTLLVNQ